MKLKLIRGMVKNAKESLSSPMFFADAEVLKNSKKADRWTIDLKNGTAVNQNGKKIDVEKTRHYHSWFLNELKNANIPLEEIDSAEAKVVFGSKEDFSLASCSVAIICNGKKFSK